MSNRNRVNMSYEATVVATDTRAERALRDASPAIESAAARLVACGARVEDLAALIIVAYEPGLNEALNLLLEDAPVTAVVLFHEAPGALVIHSRKRVVELLEAMHTEKGAKMPPVPAPARQFGVLVVVGKECAWTECDTRTFRVESSKADPRSRH